MKILYVLGVVSVWRCSRALDDEESFARGVCVATCLRRFYCCCYGGLYPRYVAAFKGVLIIRFLHAVYAHDSTEEKGPRWEEKGCVKEEGIEEVRVLLLRIDGATRAWLCKAVTVRYQKFFAKINLTRQQLPLPTHSISCQTSKTGWNRKRINYAITSREPVRICLFVMEWFAVKWWCPLARICHRRR